MLKVLVVEDEELIRKGIVLAVDWAALDCVVVGEASNGEEALDAVERLSPSLIITDLKMPRMDGIEMLRRLREAGKKVYGMGEKKTPNPFIVACDKFVYIEVIRSAAQQERAEEAAREEPKEPPKPARRAARKKGAEAAPPPAPEAEPPSRVPKEIITLLADSVEMLADEDGYAPLGEVANLLVRKKRDFDPRNFGFSKLSKLVKALPRFEVDVRQGGQSNMKHFFVRDKERK